MLNSNNKIDPHLNISHFGTSLQHKKKSIQLIYKIDQSSSGIKLSIPAALKVWYHLVKQLSHLQI